MIRMFAEGLETTPIILDDPFVHWDDERIARVLPILKAATRDGQVILLTLSENLAAAAAKAGARRHDLIQTPPPPVQANGMPRGNGEAVAPRIVPSAN
jgi:hypothetical protein